MTRWISHDLYAHIPECDGYLALSIAFAQFAAVKCGVNPFEQLELAAALGESSETQEVLRWFVRLLQSGKLRSVSRPIGGGPVAKIGNSHWHADDVVTRFLTSQYSRVEPFSAEASPDAWIFVDEIDYLQLWNEHRAQVLDAYKVRPQSPRQPRAKRTTATDDVAQTFLMGLPAVEEAVGLGRSTIYKMIDERRFPRQLKVGNRSLWRRTDIMQWIEQVGNAGTFAPPG